MKRILLFLFGILGFNNGFAQDKPAYRLYNTKGKKVKYKKLVKQAAKSDIVLFGEYHNDPIAHWLQLELTKDLQQQKQLVLGAEMIERDNQAALDAYLADEIDRTALDSLVRLWGNYETDYAPLVEFAKANQIPFIGTNIPRRYASMLFKQGIEALDDLTDEEKSWIAPLPFPFDINLPAYQSMLEMSGGNENFPKAQAIKDATMAHFILKHFVEGSTFVHYNGSFHSDNYEGIGWYLKQERPDLSHTTITIVLQEDIQKLAVENKGRADFIICVPMSMTRTH